MHEVIICEKPKSSEKIARALFPDAERKKHGKVSYWEYEGDGKRVTVVSAVGHLYSLKPENPRVEHFLTLNGCPSMRLIKRRPTSGTTLT